MFAPDLELTTVGAHASAHRGRNRIRFHVQSMAIVDWKWKERLEPNGKKGQDGPLAPTIPNMISAD